MAGFNTISSALIRVGAALKRELFEKIKNNFDDHEFRINSLETGSKKIDIMSFDIRNAMSAGSFTGLFYYEATSAFTLTEAFIRIFKDLPGSEAIEIDIKKSTTDLDNDSFSSVFITKPRISFMTASDYDASTNQVFDPDMVQVNKGDFLRLDITQAPTTYTLGRFMINVYGE